MKIKIKYNRFIILIALLVLSTNVLADSSLIREVKISSQDEYYADSLLTVPKLTTRMGTSTSAEKDFSEKVSHFLMMNSCGFPTP